MQAEHGSPAPPTSAKGGKGNNRKATPAEEKGQEKEKEKRSGKASEALGAGAEKQQKQQQQASAAKPNSRATTKSAAQLPIDTPMAAAAAANARGSKQQQHQGVTLDTPRHGGHPAPAAVGVTNPITAEQTPATVAKGKRGGAKESATKAKGGVNTTAGTDTDTAAVAEKPPPSPAKPSSRTPAEKDTTGVAAVAGGWEWLSERYA